MLALKLTHLCAARHLWYFINKATLYKMMSTRSSFLRNSLYTSDAAEAFIHSDRCIWSGRENMNNPIVLQSIGVCKCCCIGLHFTLKCLSIPVYPAVQITELKMHGFAVILKLGLCECISPFSHNSWDLFCHEWLQILVVTSGRTSALDASSVELEFCISD